MEQRSPSMAGNYILFIVLSSAILFGYMALEQRMNPRPAQPPANGKPVAAGPKAEADEPRPEPEQQRDGPAEAAPGQEPAQPPEPGEAVQDEGPEAPLAEPDVPRRWVTLGSADPSDPYRMLVTLDNKGAAVARIELSSPGYHDLENRSGFLGHLVIDPSAPIDALPIDAVPIDAAPVDGQKKGAKAGANQGVQVQVVGPGTPAAAAGLKPGDRIPVLENRPIADARGLEDALRKTKPGQQVTLTVLRGSKKLSLAATLRRQPLELIRPEADDPLSFLCTLSQLGDQKLQEQWSRDRCLFLLFEKAHVREDELAALDLADLNTEDSASWKLAKGRPDRRWVDLPDSAKAVLEPWLSARGKHSGPLFHSMAPGSAGRRLSTKRIYEVVSRMQDGSEGKRDAALFGEFDGLDLRTGNWEVVSAEVTEASFRRRLPQLGLEITKTYRLAKIPAEKSEGKQGEAYHLIFDVKIRNTADEVCQVAYALDGPNGLPDEGAWYANKVGRSWGAVGLRDVVVSFDHATPSLIGCPKIADGYMPVWQDQSLTYIGVDAQYFSCVLLPQKADPTAIWFAQSQPLLVGKPNEEMRNKTNTSCRLLSKVHDLAPSGQPGDTLSHPFKVFAGPKQRQVLADYGLDELIYYGWFGWLAKPMAVILHSFFYVVPNYGLAILLLTVLVRGCMFPLSRKQALGARKMQELQPEIKKIQEKYKKDMEGRTKAQQELFRKHNYNPLSGCLVLFIQLPIFVALYRSLMVDIELRQAPLISQGIRWCSNLSAPDMLFDWSGFMPEFISRGVGIFGLGPYFNLLPVLTIFLFIAQQKMFMPPPADEQAAMQQKIMKYMMVFIGFLFFKVASGLCIYFIASSLWGLAERQFLPKSAPTGTAAAPRSRADVKAQAKPARPAAPSGRDGAAARKNKGKKNRGKK